MLDVTIYSAAEQVADVFDNGNIILQKPIGFPQQQAAVKRVGPLFYWSWAHTKTEGGIGLHPHQGFEVLSYVINGRLEHGDTLGTESTVGSGGAQLMLTGSGISHREKMYGPDAESFQIWFEPELSQSVKRQPAYFEYTAEDFPVLKLDQAQIKTIIGEGSPIRLVTDAKMWDITLEPDSEYELTLPSGYSFAALAIRGNGSWSMGGESKETVSFNYKDFSVLKAETETETVLLAAKEEPLRMTIIQLPNQVDYPLYRR